MHGLIRQSALAGALVVLTGCGSTPDSNDNMGEAPAWFKGSSMFEIDGRVTNDKKSRVYRGIGVGNSASISIRRANMDVERNYLIDAGSYSLEVDTKISEVNYAGHGKTENVSQAYIETQRLTVRNDDNKSVQRDLIRQETVYDEVSGEYTTYILRSYKI